ncbi:TonB-dependent receptor P3 [Dyadobacter sp. CECT 9275]|uniref:TonB-dependent receptor P3 n=1 Tax=Dyadobacter helix TaxID=2822344 RepID=A0A916JIE5_9BACT|nr:SusC/RagA family TonB-linked outer membrane protein [Dyadobacter sp. CECT 9275]CAG5018143.1 TonB-dependent receptor P3 [Dyadobacter sp. CECT 9275]
MEKSLPRGEVVHYILMTMKYSAFLFMLICSVCSLATAAETYGQKLNKPVTLRLKNVTLNKALDEISEIADVRFVFVGDVPENPKINLKVTREKLSTVLSKLLDTYALTYIQMENNIVIRKAIHQNQALPAKEILALPYQLRITGKVTDERGDPLPGVNIIIKGTTQGTNTDGTGAYQVSVPEQSAVLIFSFVGYETQERTVGNASEINVSLKADIKALNEVVVVGYSSKQLSQLSSSVSVVSGKKLNDVTSNNVTDLLQGKAAGVVISNASGDPNATPNIVIRGSSSISAGSDPLYVVDGIIGGNANPTDIESVTILKDAAATGLYGARAANGVVIITTKSGKAGKTQISVSSTVGINSATNSNFRVMNSQQLYDYEKSFYPAQRFDTEIPASVLSQNTNWQDLAFRNGLTQNHVISISGGSDKTRFYVSGNYYKEDGTLKFNSNERYNFRTNISHKINEKLRLNVKFNTRMSDQRSEPSGLDGALYGAYNNMPWDNPYNADGSVKRGTEGGWYGREQENFLHGWQYNQNGTKGTGYDGDINLDYSILPNLTFYTYNRVSLNNSKTEIYYDVRSKAGKGNGRLDNRFNNSRSLITSNRLVYDKTIGRHTLSALAVAEAEKNYTEFNTVLGEGLAPGLHVMSAASRILSATGGISENAFSKGLVQLDYNYDNRYFAVGSFINEASSRFGANNRSANFYTLGGSWILSNESFMKEQTTFNFLKIRASYGLTGNANIPNYQSMGLYSYSVQYAGNSGSFPLQMPNDNLTWEKARTVNLGLDLTVFKRISFTADVYNKTTKGLLLNVEMPYTSGFSSVIQNVGSVQNKGLELNLNTENLVGPLKWETNFNIAFNRSKVLRLSEGKDIRSGNLIISVGQDLYTWNMRKWAGVDPQTGDPLWEKISTDTGSPIVTTTNSYNQATQQNTGSASPDFTGGISNTLTFKGFTFFAFLNFVSGNKIYNNSRTLFDSDGSYYTYNSMVLADGWSRWEKPGDIATHPKPVFGGNKDSHRVSSRFLEDGSYLRLRNISLSYELPASVLKGVKIANARIFVSADNLWTATRFSGMDPEVVLGPGGGTSSIKYPISKKLLFGISLGL